MNVKIDYDQCKQIAKCLAPLKLRPSHFNHPFLSFPADNETKLRAFLFDAAICHQTHTLINKVKKSKGLGVYRRCFH